MKSGSIRLCTVLAWVVGWLLDPVAAWVSPRLQQTYPTHLFNPQSSDLVRSSHWQLYAGSLDDDGNDVDSPKNGNGNGKDDEESDVEAMRRQLQSLIPEDGRKKSDKLSGFALLSKILASDGDEVALPPPPPLTSIERDRRLAELTLLAKLEDGDEALEELWSLWFSEKGPKAQVRLQETDQYLPQPHRWDEAERILEELIDEYGVYFVEPINRLATLYFLQSKLKESYRLCLIVLAVKPWHFGALSGMVAVCMGRNDGASARKWAELRLPSAAPGNAPNPRRSAWIKRAVTDAKASLKRAERRTVASFGVPDTYDAGESVKEDNDGNFEGSIRNIADDDGAWQ